MARKIIVCPDSFKGSLSAEEAAAIISDTLQNKYPEADVITIPLADGGEGTALIMQRSAYPLMKTLSSVDALGRKIKAHCLLDDSRKKAFIESADTIGLPQISSEERNIMEASSYGLGVVMAQLVDCGVEEITVSLGGSATCDGGMGMLEALGIRFYDSEGHLLRGCGGNLCKICKIEISPEFESVRKAKFSGVADVNNPLLGLQGAARVYGPQKGAGQEEVAELDMGLSNFVNVCREEDFDDSCCDVKAGAGAAGGIGFALMGFLDADMKKGIDFVMDTIEFQTKIEGADLIITGEGKLDCQSLMGKVLSGVLKEGLRRGIPVIGIGGKVEDKEALLRAGLQEVYAIADPRLSLEENMLPEVACRNLRRVVAANL